MDREETAQVIAALYNARLNNDAEECLKYFSDDAIFALPGSPATSILAKAVLEEKSLETLLRTLVATWDWKEIRDVITIIDGEHAAVRYTLVATYVPSGETIETEIMDHLVVDTGGKISKLSQFVDTAMSEQLARSPSYHQS